jgi:tRNA (guanine-N7-)-methyltransferase
MNQQMTTNETPAQENDEKTITHRREIKSFVRREGRTTPAQERALNELLPVYGIDYCPDQQLNFTQLFGNDNPVWLEIGFGMGQSLASMAERMPEINFLGIEVHRPGVGSLLNAVQEKNLTNIRIMSHDAVDVLKNMIAENSLARLLLFFPDPWHKTRHHKRRIVQAEFMSLVASRLSVGGAFHAATDWEPYAQWMMEVLDTHPHYQNPAGTGNFAIKPDYRPETKFERRGQRLGHGVWDLIYVKQ